MRVDTKYLRLLYVNLICFYELRLPELLVYVVCEVPVVLPKPFKGVKTRVAPVLKVSITSLNLPTKIKLK